MERIGEIAHCFAYVVEKLPVIGRALTVSQGFDVAQQAADKRKFPLVGLDLAALGFIMLTRF